MSEPDWSREAKRWWHWWPSRSLLASIRSYQRAVALGGIAGSLLQAVAVIRHRFWSAMSGADIPLACRFGGGLLLPHPNGIVIHPDVRIGVNCLIFQQVTLGHAGAGVPTVGDRVDFGAGAKVLGAITIGDGAVIGANAVVLIDVPAGATAVGIPAKILGVVG